MLDKTESVITKNTTSGLSHLAFCALAALGLARQNGRASTPYAENLFLIRWLATAQKQKRFPKSVAADIIWLLERGRKHGLAGKLRQHLDYLWRSCSGNLAAQSDLFRLTYASETLKDQGWDMQQLDAQGVTEPHQVINRMMGYITPELHQIWAGNTDKEMMALTQEYPGFYA